MVLRSKQKKVKTTVSKTGVEVETIYCRRCMQHKIPREFWSAVDTEIDRNGFFSVCSDCCNEMFDSFVISEGSIEAALLTMCRKLNMKYDEAAIESAKKQIETVRASGKAVPSFLSIYKIKLVSTQSSKFDKREPDDLTYQEVTTINVSQDVNTLRNFDPDEIDPDVIMFWGEGFETKDYAWLEKTMDEWKKTHRSDTMSEQVLLKEIVMKQFEIKKTREANKPVTSAMLRDLQDLMKTSAVDPSKANQASNGRHNDTFSAFIRMIEENRPAEYYQDRKLFEDFDGLEQYFLKFISRPLKNFITGSRDFSLEDNDEEEEAEWEAEDISTLALNDGEESEA